LQPPPPLATSRAAALSAAFAACADCIPAACG
jgi:hypothetical protein